VRIGRKPLLGRRDPDARQRGGGARAGGALRDALVRADRLDHLRVDPQDRIERRHRVLEDHRDPPAAQAPQRALGKADEFLALEPDRPGRDASGRVDEAEDREAGDGLAGARFPDEPQHLAAADLEGHAVDGHHEPLAGLERDREVAHRQDGAHRASLGLSTSRSRSPTTLIATMTITSATPGKVETQYLPESR
jgi:hypothetical protein